MLTKIGLENFKCFEHLDLDLARITVLIGPNGTGKSSVLQSLMLLRQSSGAGRLRYGDMVSFSETISANESPKVFSIRIQGSLTAEFETIPVSLNRFDYETTIDDDGIVHQSGNYHGSHEIGSRWVRNDPNIENNVEVYVRTVSEDGKRDNISVLVSPNSTIAHPLKTNVRYRNFGSEDLPVAETKKLASIVQNYIAEAAQLWRFVPAIRGFSRPNYNLRIGPVHDITYEADLGTQGEEIASTLKMRAGRQQSNQISAWIAEVTGVGIEFDTEPDHRVAPQSRRTGSANVHNLTNEGFATNQLVFLFFQLAKAYVDSTVGIEEPEIHLHPAAQAKLADLFVRVSKDENKQIIMTTHSEHILFALLNNVAEGKLDPEELAVYSFERTGPGCTATRLNVTAEGMVEGEPPGFFEANLEAQKRHMDAMSKAGKAGMSLEFVLDEWVIICAATLENPAGARDRSSSDLITTILAQRHVLALDSPVYARWSQKLSDLRLEKRVINPVIPHLLTGATFSAGTVRFYQDSPPLVEDDSWSDKTRDDKDFIRLAAQCHGVLSTGDQPLIDDIVQRGMSTRYEFQVVTVDEARELASQSG